MQLQPAAFVYLAIQRMGTALIIGLMIGVFTGGFVGGATPQNIRHAGQPGAHIDFHAGVQNNGNARSAPPSVQPQFAQRQAYVNWPAFTIMGLFAILSFPVVLLYAWFLAKSYRIELRQDGLYLQYGVVATTNEILPYTKIQDVVISQGLLGRLMSLATIKIQNAMGRPQIIPGCSLEDAETLRDAALARVRPV